VAEDAIGTAGHAVAWCVGGALPTAGGVGTVFGPEAAPAGALLGCLGGAVGAVLSDGFDALREALKPVTVTDVPTNDDLPTDDPFEDPEKRQQTAPDDPPPPPTNNPDPAPDDPSEGDPSGGDPSGGDPGGGDPIGGDLPPHEDD